MRRSGVQWPSRQCGSHRLRLRFSSYFLAPDNWVATVPRVVYEHCTARSELVLVPVQDPLPEPIICTVRRHDMSLTPAATKLIAWIQHYALKR